MHMYVYIGLSIAVHFSSLLRGLIWGCLFLHLSNDIRIFFLLTGGSFAREVFLVGVRVEGIPTYRLASLGEIHGCGIWKGWAGGI